MSLVDPLDVPRQVMADFGIPVRVVPVGMRDEYGITALFSPRTEDAELGQGRGALGTHLFRVLPEEAGQIEEGDILVTEDGGRYAAFEPLRVPGRLVEVRVVER